MGLTGLQHVELFSEVAAQHHLGPSGKWTTVTVVELLKHALPSFLPLPQWCHEAKKRKKMRAAHPHALLLLLWSRRALFRLGLLKAQGGRMLVHQKVPERAELLTKENQHLFTPEALLKASPHRPM